MEKKKSIAVITLISILSALLIVFAIISFMPKNKVFGYAGFAGAIKKGTDLENGIAATYSATKDSSMTDEEFKTALDSTYNRVCSIIEQKGYEGAQVYLTSNGKIRIECPDIDDASEVMELIGSGELRITTSSDGSGDSVLTGANITSAFATQETSSFTWGAYIGFDEDAQSAIKTATKDATSSSSVTLYFFRGASESAFTKLSFSQQYTDSAFFISYSGSSMTQSQATYLALQVLTGSFKASLETDGGIETLSASAGSEANLGIIIAAASATLAILIIFAIVYRELGLMSIISILMYIGGMLFFMQAIPVISLSSASIGGALIGLVLITVCHFIFLEKVRCEFALGKKLKTCVKTGYKKSVTLISEICGAIAIISLITYFIFTGAVKSFTMILLTASLLSLLITLLVTYYLTKAYATLNPTNGKRVNFLREETTDEIE